MKTIIKIAVPIALFVIAIVIFKVQMSNRPEPKKKPVEKIVPIVRSVEAEGIYGYRYQVEGFGNVQAAKKLDMVSETAGRVVWLNEKMISGGRFTKGEPVMRIDKTAYQSALDSKKAALKNAELELQKIKEQSEISQKEWEIWNQTSGSDVKPSPLVSYKPQMEAAVAAVRAAESAVASAERDLEKTSYYAPFSSVVISENTELGKVIRAGESFGTIVGTDAFEVTLPIAAKDAVKVLFSENETEASDGYIELAEGSKSWRWDVSAERILPDADSRTGMLKAVLKVKKPFDTKNGKRPILPIGASVKAVIKDKKTENTVKIPDEAVREGGLIWVLEDSRVQIRQISITEKRGDYVYVSEGVLPGEKIITSALNGVVDGMEVNTGQMNKKPEKAKDAGGGVK